MYGSFFLNLLYNDEDPLTYAGIQVKASGQLLATFNSGNPTVDYFASGAFCELLSPDCRISGSSSLDHFVMDGGKMWDEGDAINPEHITQAKQMAQEVFDRDFQPPTPSLH